jgi:hypothetical protein
MTRLDLSKHQVPRITKLLEQMQVMIQASYEFISGHHSLGTGIVFVINNLNQPKLLKLSNPTSCSAIRDATTQ